MQSLRGVYNILSTPFSTDGSLDVTSLRRLTEATLAAGVDGITVLGVAGEAHKLNAEEREMVIRAVVEVSAGRVPVIAGTSHDGTDTTIQASQLAEQLGATGLMIAPPSFLQPGPALTEHYRRIAEATATPIVLQDFPPVNAVTMSPQVMADLCKEVPAIKTIKLEDVPTPQRTNQTLALTGDAITIVGGLGGMYLLDELRRGSAGTMTGFAYPEALVAMYRAWESGDRDKAADLYYRCLPLLVYEGQPKIGGAIRKEILRRRGLIEHGGLRHPGPVLDQGTADDLNATLNYVDMDRLLGAQV